MNRNKRFIAWIVGLTAPSLALFFAISTAAGTWERVRTQPKKRTIRVTGSAKQRIVSDLIEWRAVISTTAVNRTAAYSDLQKQAATAVAYLKEQGLPDSAVRLSSVTTQELFETQYLGQGESRVQKTVSKGWSLRQSISVESQDIPRVERVSREITKLLSSGVSIVSDPPRYHFTKLDQLKIEMLARAADNARERAQKIVGAAGGAAPEKLWAADMGVINVNPANSTATSWEGNNDKSSLEKDIITIVHLTYELP